MVYLTDTGGKAYVSGAPSSVSFQSISLLSTWCFALEHNLKIIHMPLTQDQCQHWKSLGSHLTMNDGLVQGSIFNSQITSEYNNQDSFILLCK